MLHVPLNEQFRYIHEPLPVGDRAIPVLGHETLVAALKQRLTYSHGGAFLVTGFRGVGKSTLVLRALAETATAWSDREELLVVHLNVSRSMTTDQLLFAVVRRIFESLDDLDLLARLPRDVQRSLVLAYSRTSLSFTQTQSESSERSTALGLSPQHRMSPTVSFTGRRTRSQAVEAAFLAYSETDVEHDLVRIVHLLNGSEGRRPVQQRRRRRVLRRQRDRFTRFRVHPVVVLDEVDKLTDNNEEKIIQFEALLGRIKNVLTARGAHFIVVAGPDLHDRAIQDAERGNGVYESVFGWRMYVPCLWDGAQRLVNGLVEAQRTAGVEFRTTYTAFDEPRLTRFVEYLCFKARGVPRRLLQEFNSAVVWENGYPWLSLSDDEWARVDFYAHLEAVVSETLQIDEPNAAPGRVAIDDDRRRLGGYHVLDWAARSEGRPFTSTDVTGAEGVNALLRIAPPTVERLLRHLVHAGMLDVVSESGRPEATRYGGAESTLAYYKLSDTYKRYLAGFARRSESERADLGIVSPPPGPGLYDPTVIDIARSDATTPSEPSGIPLPTGPPLGTPSATTPAVGVLAGRYEMSSLLGQGGMGAVYRGRDLLTGRPVAVKVLHQYARSNDQMLARFEREAQVSRQLNHPNIVRTLDTLSGPGVEPALIMELVEGPSLADALHQHGALPAGLVVRIGRQLGEALTFIDSMGFSRIDLKPSNVLLHAERGAVIIDLGIARPMGDAGQVTVVGMVIGTPGYMAPEQVLGNTADIRTDLYTLGILMYRCLAGAAPWSAASTHEVLFEIAHADVSVTALPVSEQLRSLLGRMLSRSPSARPQQPEAFLQELASTPEAGEEMSLQEFEESPLPAAVTPGSSFDTAPTLDIRPP